MHARWRLGCLIVIWIACRRDQGLVEESVLVFRFCFVGSQLGQKSVDSSEQPIVDYALILESFNLVFSLCSLLVDLVLFCPYERLLVYVWVRLEV